MSSNDTTNQNIEDAVNPIPAHDIELAAVPPGKDIDPYLVAFDEPFDSDNPTYVQRQQKADSQMQLLI